MIDIKHTNAAAIAAQMASQGARSADATAFESLMSALATEARTPVEGVARRGEDHSGTARDSRPAPAKPAHVGVPEPAASVRPSTTRRDNAGKPGNVRADQVERPERPGRPERVQTKDSTTPQERAEAAKPTDESTVETTKSADTEQVAETTPAAEDANGANSVNAQSVAADAGMEIMETLAPAAETTAEVTQPASDLDAAPVAPLATETQGAEPETVSPAPVESVAATGVPEAPAAAQPVVAEAPIDGADIAAQLKSGKAPSLIPAKPEAVIPVAPETTESPAMLVQAALTGQTAGNTANTTAAGASNAGSSSVSAVSGTSAQTTPVASAAPAAAPAASAPNPVAQAAPTYAPNLSQQLFDQMQHQLSRLKALGQGQHQLKLAINPETFGPVRVAANFHADGTVHLQLLGASEAARDQLRQVLSDLRRDLASTGLQADLDVAENAQEFAQFTGAGAGSSERETGRAGQAGAASTDGSETEEIDVVSAPRVGDVLKDGTDGSVDMFA